MIKGNVLFTEREKSSKYNNGIDLLKMLAMLLVTVVHTTTLNGFSGGVDTVSVGTVLISFEKMFAYCCVPLFMLATGYLTSNKTPTLTYYSKIFKFLLNYFLCVSTIYIFQIVWLKEKFNLISYLKFTLNIHNQWYMNMYIGLFLLIPFLNLIYKNLNSLKQKLAFLLILIIVFSLPASCAVFSFNYWLTAYPIMYYFIGSFFSEYKLNFSNIIVLIVLFLSLLISTVIYVFNLPFSVENYCNIFCMISSVSIFAFLKEIFVTKKNLLVKICRKIADMSLSYYFIGAICENFLIIKFYDTLGLVTMYERLAYRFITIPATVIINLFFAFTLSYLTNLLYKLFIIIFSKFSFKMSSTA